MKTRTSLISNSSSSSFIIRGIKVNLKDFCNHINLSNYLIDEYRKHKIDGITEVLREQFDCNLEVIPFKNYFDFGEGYKEAIVGLNSKKKFEDGDVVEIGLTDEIDNDVRKEFEKIKYNEGQLTNWIQYVSNDNC